MFTVLLNRRVKFLPDMIPFYDGKEGTVVAACATQTGLKLTVACDGLPMVDVCPDSVTLLPIDHTPREGV